MTSAIWLQRENPQAGVLNSMGGFHYNNQPKRISLLLKFEDLQYKVSMSITQCLAQSNTY